MKAWGTLDDRGPVYMTSSEQELNLPSASTVARYIRHLAGRDGVKNLDQYKIQKILYFTQCWSLASRCSPLFRDPVRAFDNGPVVYDVWREYTDYSSHSIPPCDAPDNHELSEDDRSFIEAVWEDLRSFTGKQLRDFTHRSQPWVDVYESGTPWGQSSDVIPHQLMERHYHELMCAWRGTLD